MHDGRNICGQSLTSSFCEMNVKFPLTLGLYFTFIFTVLY